MLTHRRRDGRLIILTCRLVGWCAEEERIDAIEISALEAGIEGVRQAMVLIAWAENIQVLERLSSEKILVVAVLLWLWSESKLLLESCPCLVAVTGLDVVAGLEH